MVNNIDYLNRFATFFKGIKNICIFINLHKTQTLISSTSDFSLLTNVPIKSALTMPSAPKTENNIFVNIHDSLMTL